jgi:ABC-type branched-subunit amino acid transport system ATPase component
LTLGEPDRECHIRLVTLEAQAVVMRFGGVEALRGVSLALAQGEIVGLIGPNGSGKTTLLNCLSGVFRPTAGAVAVDGRPLTGSVHRVARRGVVRTFQNIRLFGRLTALQNVEAGALGAGRVPRRRSRDFASAVLRELGIARLADRFVETLSYGDQRRVEIARALAARPRFLLLDEPAAGMHDGESDELAGSIERIRADHGCGLLVVEHDLRLIMRVCESIVVLNEGDVISRGRPEEVRADPAVVAAYIGTEAPTGATHNGGGT